MIEVSSFQTQSSDGKSVTTINVALIVWDNKWTLSTRISLVDSKMKKRRRHYTGHHDFCDSND